MTAFSTLLYEEHDGIATIALNRPASRNAINMTMRYELVEAFAHIEQTTTVKAVVLCGAGGHFTSGGDIKAMKDSNLDAVKGYERMQPVVACAKAILQLGKPVIAAVDGVAYGGGLGLALCSDLMIVTPGARMSCSFMKVGLVHDFLSSFTLPRIVGWQRAKQLTYTARELSGAEALEMGIALELVEAGELAQRAREIALAMAAASPTAFALAKTALLRSLSADLSTMADQEMLAQGICLSTPWHKEALQNLLDKKPSAFEFR